MTGDSARPRLHLTAPANWLSDPNAPLYWNGRYHLFYQHNSDSPQWGLMRWGHAVSEDLLHWTDQGIALRPTPGGPDADGCWSGCARVIDGRPVFFYTGAAGEGADHHQRVLRAVGDPDLGTLRPEPASAVLSPPVAALGTLQQRDPFLLRHDDRWLMLLGTGLRSDDGAGGGAVVAWESTDTLTWSCRGILYEHPAGGDGIDTGPVWECPQLLRVDGAWVLIVSVQLPGPRCPYAVWFVGDFDGERFAPTATGLMDHGEVFYAPAVTEGVADRALLWGWLQEGGRAGAPAPPGIAGAMSLPRELSVRDGRLHCRPSREVEAFWSATPRAAHAALGLPDGGSATLARDVPTAYRLRFALEPGGGRAGAILGSAGGRPIWLGVVGTPTPRLVAGTWRDGAFDDWYSAPLPLGRVAVDIHRDAGIVECFAEGRALTLRVDGVLDGGVLLSGDGEDVEFSDVVLVASGD